MLTYPNIDPVAFTVFGWPVRWYGVCASAGLSLGWVMMRHYNAKYAPYFLKPIQPQHIDNVMPYLIICIVLGGRLGHLLFYDLDCFMQNPILFFRIDRGGFSIHGDIIGGGTALYAYSKRHNLPFGLLCDITAVSFPIGLSIVRIGNFINAELYGRVTHSGWGMVFPGHKHPRHPSQLYEAFFEGIVLFILLRILFPYAVKRRLNGLIAGVFFFGYALARFFVEYVREPVDGEFRVFGFIYSYGQILTAPMIVIGAFMCIRILFWKKPVQTFGTCQSL